MTRRAEDPQRSQLDPVPAEPGEQATEESVTQATARLSPRR